jgi:hypothetical protein
MDCLNLEHSCQRCFDSAEPDLLDTKKGGFVRSGQAHDGLSFRDSSQQMRQWCHRDEHAD